MRSDTLAEFNMGEPGCEGWQPPVPLIQANLPPFPCAALPHWLRSWAVAEAEALQVPVDLPACVALGMVSAISAGHVVVEVRTNWSEYTNTFWVVVLPPGEGKSPVFRHAVAPLHEFETRERERVGPIIAAAQAKLQLAEEKTKLLRSRAAKAKPMERDEAEQRLEEAAVAAQSIIVPRMPRYTTADATPEVVALRLRENAERFAVFSAEGGGPFEIMAGRYSDGNPNLEVFLMAHAGDHYAVDRIGRESFVLQQPLLTMVLTVQPHVLTSLSAKPSLRARGLIARFFYSMPVSRVGRRNTNPTPVPPEVAETYGRMMDRLLGLYGRASSDGDAPQKMSFDTEAHDIFVRTIAAIEPRLAPGADLASMAGWGAKYPGALARIAGILHVADCVATERAPSTISAETLRRALLIGDYLLQHAKAAMLRMGADPATDDALHVIAWLKRTRRATVQKRDIYRADPTRFPTAGKVDPTIQLLVEHGYLRPIATRRDGPGRSPSATFAVSPFVHSTELTQSQPTSESVNSVDQTTGTDRTEAGGAVARERIVFPLGGEVTP